MSGRFVAGMSIDDVLAACERVNKEGIAATLDSLGESVTTEAEAQKSADIYHQLLDAIEARKLNANVSVKLSQIGMDFDPALAERIVGEMVAHAAAVHSFVRIDMEGSPYTEATIAMTERLSKKNPGAGGTLLQAYLFRPDTDTDRLLGQGIRIRLCKGAYKEDPDVAFPLKVDVDANYVTLMKRMVTYANHQTGKGVFCGIATHDEAIVDKMRTFVNDNKIDKHAFEFQMLYGVRRDLQRRLADEGYVIRVYIPFGPEWYPYFMRRLAERPANVLFLAKNFFKN